MPVALVFGAVCWVTITLFFDLKSVQKSTKCVANVDKLRIFARGGERGNQVTMWVKIAPSSVQFAVSAASRRQWNVVGTVLVGLPKVVELYRRRGRRLQARCQLEFAHDGCDGASASKRQDAAKDRAANE
jgi:hypothetical protein